MQSLKMLALGLAMLFLAGGCATTVERRIEANRELFEQYPSEIQEAIREQRIKPGFDQEMVRLALGGPDVVRRRTTEEHTDEAWVYTRAHPRYSVGVGGSVGGHRSGVGTGVGVGTGGRVEVMRVVFRNNRVYAIEE